MASSEHIPFSIQKADITPSDVVRHELDEMFSHPSAEPAVDQDATLPPATYITPVRPSVEPAYKDEHAVYRRTYGYDPSAKEMVAGPAQRVPELELPSFPADETKRW